MLPVRSSPKLHVKRGGNKKSRHLEMGDCSVLSGFLIYCFQDMIAFFYMMSICLVLPCFGGFVFETWQDKFRRLAG